MFIRNNAKWALSYRTAFITLAYFTISFLPYSSQAENLSSSEPQDTTNQNKKAKTEKLFSIFNNSKTDTTYVIRPKQNWLIRPKSNTYGYILHIKSNIDGKKLNYAMEGNIKTTVGLSASYKGISAGFSLNPAKWFNKTKDYEYNINIYTNRIGIDFTHGKRTSMKGYIASERINRIDHSGIRLKNTSINAYYNFNNKKFSYPAIFSHSWIQKKSAGSFLAAITYHDTSLSANFTSYENPLGNIHTLTKFKIRHLGIGAGYGYNFVPNQHWLLHLSAQPSILVWKEYNMEYIDPANTKTKLNAPTKFPEIHLIGRFGITYSFKNLFIGLNGVIQHFQAGEKDNFSIGSTQWRGQLSFGIRI